jgi:hypothetical protein
MPDNKDITQQNGEAPFEPERLLHDLKAMPRVSAPMDFSYHLSKAIEEIEIRPATSWWKRLFIPATEGGFRIPGVAYGAVTVMVVLFFSVYVFKVTDFDRDLQQELDPNTPAEETMPALDAAAETEAETPSSSEQAGQGNIAPETQPATPVTEPAARETQPATPVTEPAIRDAQPAVRDAQPAVPPADVPVSKERVPVPESAGRPENAKREKSTTVLPAAVPVKPQSLNDGESEYRVRGFLEVEKQISQKDSIKYDSLRRLDSIRRQKIGAPEQPPANPR